MNRSSAPRFGRRPRSLARLILPAILVVVFLARYFLGDTPAPTQFDAQPIAADTYQVERVVDGDTLIMLIDDPPGSKPRRERLRLLQIDTPETVKPDHPVEPWGPEASAFTKDFLAGGKARIEFDKRRVDQYGRYLAYVYVGDRMLNEALVAEGLARVSHYSGDSQSILRRLRKAETSAKEAGKGIWADAKR